MDVCLKIKYIVSKGQDRDSHWGVIFNIFPLFIWLQNKIYIYTI